MRPVLERVAWIASTAALATALTAIPASAGTLEVDISLAGVTAPSTEPVTGTSVGDFGGINLNSVSAFRCQPNPSSGQPTLAATGTVEVGNGQGPTGLASLSSVTFNNPCTAIPGPIPTYVTAENLPWSFDATGETDALGVSPGRLTGVKLKVELPSLGCAAMIGGPEANGSGGYIDSTYINPMSGSGDAGVFKFLRPEYQPDGSITVSHSNLRVTQIIYGPCPRFLFALGDKFGFAGKVEIRGDNATNNEGPTINAYEVP